MWGKYKYPKKTNGFFNIPDIFQENISELFEGFNMVFAYIYDLSVITKHDFSDHLKALENFYRNLLRKD